MKNKLRNTVAIIMLLSIIDCKSPEKTSPLPIQQVFERLLGETANQFSIEIISKANKNDVFEIETIGDKIALRGSSQTAIGYAMNHYLSEYCHSQLSRAGSQINIPDPLPKPSQKIRKESPYQHRYFLNYCTYNYTMSFWDWEQWEKEIDMMALQGVNLVLTINGTEAVWQNTLKKFGYTNEEILEFIPGPAYQAWWLMGNLEGWGGPVSQQWIDNRVALQQKILQRMRELNIEPILHGFYGMVPSNLKSKKPEAHIIEGGDWCGFDRPAYLVPTDSLFKEMAAVYYDEMEKLYGKVKYYGGDPFHEGGNTEGVDIQQSGKIIQEAMLEKNAKAIWVLQGWMDNPKPEMLAGLNKDNTIILDLFADNIPSWKYRKGFDGFPWVWCTVANFGHREDLYGRLQQIAAEPYQATQSAYYQNMVGIGVIPEGSIPNPVVRNMVFDVAWQNKEVNPKAWLTDYAYARYGQSLPKAEKAWHLLFESVYSCFPADSGEWGRDETQPIICARPTLHIESAAHWGKSEPYYATDTLKKALKELYSCKSDLKGIDTYEYDLVTVCKDVLSNEAYTTYQTIVTAFKVKDKKAFDTSSQRLLGIIDDMNRLVGTRKEYLLGTWIADAKKIAPSKDEESLFEYNAKMLLTTWGVQDTMQEHVLHDYAYKTWNGLLKDYYKPRWEMFINHVKDHFDQKSIEDLNYYDFETKWIEKDKDYQENVVGNVINEVGIILEKYDL